MFCTACGMKNAAESRFCKQCGHELDKTMTGRVREEDFDRALPEDEHINALLERAYRARKAGDNPGAIALCQEALQLRPDSTTPHSLLGQIYESMGERDLAIRAYERVLHLNPGSIADRVKLDELRDGALPVLPGALPPHIVFTQPRGRQGGNQLLSSVALAAFLLVIGAGIGLAWRGRSNPSPGVEPDGARKGGPRAADLATNGQNSNNQNSNNGAGSGGVQSPSAPTSATADRQTASAPTAYGAYPWNMPPTIIYTQPERVRTVQVPAAVSGETNLAAVHLPGAKSGTAGGRVMLPTDDQTDDSKGTISIHVDPKDRQKPTAPEPVNPGKISVTPTNPRGATVDNSQQASFESRSYIAAANDYEVNGDYDKAITAYSRALGAAGDERGSVYQHIAHSYQRKGDKTSAVTNYHNAISEYHKLIDAGKQVEPAQEGINTCEKAIKACNY